MKTHQKRESQGGPREGQGPPKGPWLGLTQGQVLYSMCCAQTAAPEGKKNKRREMQKRGDCIIKSIITECSKNRAQDHSRYSRR